MFKKILAVFIGFACISNIAMAEVDPRTECVADGFGVTLRNQTEGSERPAIRADYVVYFDNNESNIPDACSPKVDEVVQKLRKQKNDIDAILMFGSADATGTADHNAELARARANTVAELLKTEGHFTDEQLCMYDSDGKVNSTRCARITMGDAFGREKGYLESSHWTRAVFMYVIYKRDKCDESTMRTLDELIKVLPNEERLKDAKSLCPNEDVLLLQSQRQQIMDAISYAVQNYPEKVNEINLSNDEKKVLYMNSLIYVRNDAITNPSVWTTKEGKFNYARLISDSVAGVALGTVGGIITSKVVKKNQLKRGFEDVMCTIGGQNVANYADEFTVGLQELK